MAPVKRRGSSPGDIDSIVYAARPRIISGLQVTGVQGPPGPKPNVWRGQWAVDTSYDVGDIVYLATSPAPPLGTGGAILSYLCLEDHTSSIGTKPVPDGIANVWHEISPGYLIIDGVRAMTGNLNMNTHEVDNVVAVDFIVSPTHTHAEGGLHWDGTNGREAPVADVLGGLQLLFGSVYYRVKNVSGSTIPAFRNVRVFSADGAGNILTVKSLEWSTVPASLDGLGVTMHSIANNAEGWVCGKGHMEGVDLSIYTQGQKFFLGDDSGGMASSAPLKGCAVKVQIGYVVKAANPGTFKVEMVRWPVLGELSDVETGDALSGETGFHGGPADFDVPMWMSPGESGCYSWKDYPASMFPVAEESSDVTITGNDKYVFIFVDASSAERTVNLPNLGDTAAGLRLAKRMLVVKKVDTSNNLVVVKADTTSPADTIEGEAEYYLGIPGEAVYLMSPPSGNSDWKVIATNAPNFDEVMMVAQVYGI